MEFLNFEDGLQHFHDWKQQENRIHKRVEFSHFCVVSYSTPIVNVMGSTTQACIVRIFQWESSGKRGRYIYSANLHTDMKPMLVVYIFGMQYKTKFHVQVYGRVHFTTFEIFYKAGQMLLGWNDCVLYKFICAHTTHTHYTWTKIYPKWNRINIRIERESESSNIERLCSLNIAYSICILFDFIQLSLCFFLLLLPLHIFVYYPICFPNFISQRAIHTLCVLCSRYAHQNKYTERSEMNASFAASLWCEVIGENNSD